MKRKLFSLICATVMILSVTTTVFAAYSGDTGYYDGCTYSTSTYCDKDNFSAVIEYQYSDSGDHNDYLLQACVWYFSVDGDVYNGKPYHASASYLVSGVSKNAVDLVKINYAYKINTVDVSSGTLYA